MTPVTLAIGSRRRGALAGAVLGALSVVLLSSCSSPSAKPSQGGTHASTTTEAQTAACTPSSVAAVIDFSKIGGTATSPAGAVLFTNTSSSPCSLRGVPKVQLVGADGQIIPTAQAPSSPAHDTAAVLTPGSSGTGNRAGSSITWSSLTCLAGSYSLSVQFPGWSSAVPAGSTTGYTGPACTGPGQTVYVSPVELVTAPPASQSTTTTTAG